MPRGQDEDRRRRPRTNLAAHLDASHFWKSEVEHHEIGALRRSLIDPVASSRGLDDPRRFAERVADHSAYLRLVVHDEYDSAVHDRKFSASCQPEERKQRGTALLGRKAVPRFARMSDAYGVIFVTGRALYFK